MSEVKITQTWDEGEAKKAQKRHADLTAKFYENMRKEQEANAVQDLDWRVARELSSLDDRLKKLESELKQLNEERKE